MPVEQRQVDIVGDSGCPLRAALTRRMLAFFAKHLDRSAPAAV